MTSYSWPPAALDALRLVCDPEADAVIGETYRHGSVTAVNDLLNAMVRNDQPAPAQLPPAARAYFQETAALPDWADPALIAGGERVFMRNGVLALAGLLCASLPECYAMRNGVHVLALTQQLSQHTVRRVYETAQMVLDVTSVGGLAPNGRGVRSAQKVRLMHAAMRYLLEVDPEGVDPDEREAPTLAATFARQVWDPAWGRPINQEDMAFTLQSFSTVVLRSWEQLGVALDPNEREAYYHCWRVVGHLMGVRADLNPPTPAGGVALFNAVRAHQQGATQDARVLTKALADAVAETIGIPWVSDDAVTLLMRHLLGDATASMVGVPAASTVGELAVDGLAAILRVVTTVTGEFDEDFPLVGRIGARFGQRLLERLARLDRGGAGRLFHLPDSLREAQTR